MSTGLAVDLALPFVIAAMMLAVGMALRPADFRSVISTPVAGAVGLGCMVIMLPVLALILAAVFPMPAELKIGLVLLAASPSASTSTVFTHLARGDVALSVTLTAIGKVLPVVTIPFYVSVAANIFAGTERALELSFADTSERLLLTVLAPMVIGMGLRARFPEASRTARPLLMRAAVAALVVVIAALVHRERDQLADMLLQAGPSAASLCLLGMACAYAFARWFGISAEQRTAVTLETGMQSGGTAIAIAAGLLGSTAMAVPPAVYSLIMYVSVAVLVLAIRASRGSAPPAPESGVQ